MKLYNGPNLTSKDGKYKVQDGSHAHGIHHELATAEEANVWVETETIQEETQRKQNTIHNKVQEA